jgi:integral membrane protein (TIGR01906 family)
MGVLRTLATILFVIAIPVALVTTTIRYIANESRVYVYAIDQFDGVARTGIERSELLRASAEIRRYFNSSQEPLNIVVRDNGREAPLFNQREVVHMADVKERFQMVNRVQELSVLYAITYVAAVVLWAREVSLRSLARSVAIGSTSCLAAVGVIAAIGFAGFDSAWEKFHELIFTNDFWLLNPATDRLIQMFPPAFWESIVFMMGTLIAAQAAMLLLATGIYLGASRHHEARRRKLEPRYA